MGTAFGSKIAIVILAERGWIPSCRGHGYYLLQSTISCNTPHSISLNHPLQAVISATLANSKFSTKIISPMYSVEAESVTRDYARSTAGLEDFIGNMEVKLVSRSPTTLEFDLINAHASIANALRRILIAEVPSVAIHDISISENDTIFPDEYIAHRLGLVPIEADPELLGAAKLHFRLDTRNDTQEIQCLYSEQIAWLPAEGQEDWNVRVKPGVLICKMAPGNAIDMEITAESGIGKKHAKWSPVSLCTYKLMPRIVFTKSFSGEDAAELQACFSSGVVDIQDGRAVVVNPRIDAMSREVFRHEKFRDSVKILRESAWFCFTVESIVADPLVLLKRAVRILSEKCEALKAELQKI